MMQLQEVGPDRAIARRDHPNRLVQCLCDLAHGRRPVPLHLLRQLLRPGDDADRVGEGSFNQDRGFGHWDWLQVAPNGWGLPKVYWGSDWVYAKTILPADTVMFVPKLGSTSCMVMYNDVLRWTVIAAGRPEILSTGAV